MSDLKPCPFCGGSARLDKAMYATATICRCCGTRTINYPESDINHLNASIKATARWNTRPIEDGLMQSVRECAMRELLATRKVEELQSQIDRLTNERDEARKIAELLVDECYDLYKKHIAIEPNYILPSSYPCALPWEIKTDE